jgi:hypothetical protein
MWDDNFTVISPNIPSGKFKYFNLPTSKIIIYLYNISIMGTYDFGNNFKNLMFNLNLYLIS